MSPHLAAEQRRIAVAGGASLAFCIVVLAACYLLLPRYFSFPSGLAPSIGFALRADLFVVAWVMIASGVVSYARRHSAQDIDAALGGPPSQPLAVRIAILQNTLEQAVISVATHLALATLIDGGQLALIVGAVILFGVGRVTFAMGYARGAGGRAFGMVTTVLPSLAGMAWAFYLLVAAIV